MNRIARIVMIIAFAQASLALMKTNYGSMYDYFKENSLDFDEDDLHLLADSFYLNSHLQEADKNNLLNQIGDKIANATNQTADIGKLIASTGNVISTVKAAFGQATNPTSLVKSALGGVFGKFFRRNLQAEAVGQVVSNLENTISDAKTKQQTITNTLGTANKFVDFLKGVGSLLSGNTSGFVSSVGDKVKGWLKWNKRLLEKCNNDHHLFLDKLMSTASSLSAAKNFLGSSLGGQQQPAEGGNSTQPAGSSSGLISKLKGLWGFVKPAQQARILAEVVAANPPPSFEPTELNKVRVLFSILAAHLEHLVDKSEQVTGRHRKSLFELRAIKDRRLRVAKSAKDTLGYLNSIDEKSINFDTVEHHMWDLIQDGGLWGKGYLRGVETLKCILLHRNCPESVVVPTAPNGPLFYGTNEQVALKEGGATKVIANNVIDQEGVDNFAGAGVVDSDYHGIIQEKLPTDPLSVETVVQSVQNSILPGQNNNVIVQTDHFNPSLGNEQVIIENESKYDSFPPVSDITQGSVVHTAITHNENETADETIVPQLVQPTDKVQLLLDNENLSNNIIHEEITNVSPTIDNRLNPVYEVTNVHEPIVITNPETHSVINTPQVLHIANTNDHTIVADAGNDTTKTVVTTTTYKNGVPVESHVVTSNDDQTNNQ